MTLAGEFTCDPSPETRCSINCFIFVLQTDPNVCLSIQTINNKQAVYCFLQNPQKDKCPQRSFEGFYGPLSRTGSSLDPVPVWISLNILLFLFFSAKSNVNKENISRSFSVFQTDWRRRFMWSEIIVRDRRSTPSPGGVWKNQQTDLN